MLGLAEGAARLAGVEAAYQADGVGGWRVIAGSQSVLFGNNHTGPDAFQVSTNPDGLRTDLSRARSPGRFRVAVLGDSTVFGWGVGQSETVADGLAEGLRHLSGGVEVINAGQPGYSSVQASRLFSNVVSAYQPDLTLLFLPLHDHNRVLVSDAEHLDGAEGALPRLRVALATRSRVYEGLRRLLFPLAGQAFVLADEAGAGPRVPRVSAAERAAALDAAKQATEAWGGRLLIGHLPFAAEMTGPVGPREGEAEVAAWAQENDARLIDLRGCCSGEALLLPADPGHYSAAGHRAVGQALAAALLPLLPPPAAQTPLPEPP
jgi:hypothetical protein